MVQNVKLFHKVCRSFKSDANGIGGDVSDYLITYHEKVTPCKMITRLSFIIITPIIFAKWSETSCQSNMIELTSVAVNFKFILMLDMFRFV